MFLFSERLLKVPTLSNSGIQSLKWFSPVNKSIGGALLQCCTTSSVIMGAAGIAEELGFTAVTTK